MNYIKTENNDNVNNLLTFPRSHNAFKNVGFKIVDRVRRSLSRSSKQDKNNEEKSTKTFLEEEVNEALRIDFCINKNTEEIVSQ